MMSAKTRESEEQGKHGTTKRKESDHDKGRNIEKDESQREERIKEQEDEGGEREEGSRWEQEEEQGVLFAAPQI